MIIDIHTHYGIVQGRYDMPIEIQLNAMKKYHIDYALISNIECTNIQESITGNARMIEIVRKNADTLGCMLWGNESLSDEQKHEFDSLCRNNKDVVKGIKLHPDISQRRADDKCFEFFYEMAEKYELPVLLHTKNNQFSAIPIVAQAAKEHTDVKFILGHMGICTDGEEALNAVKKYENIYGDTAWVKLDVVKKAVKMGIAHKLMFGTDSPISGPDCYGDAYYCDYYTLHTDYMKDVMAKNAIRFFGL